MLQTSRLSALGDHRAPAWGVAAGCHVSRLLSSPARDRQAAAPEVRGKSMCWISCASLPPRPPPVLLGLLLSTSPHSENLGHIHWLLLLPYPLLLEECSEEMNGASHRPQRSSSMWSRIEQTKCSTKCLYGMHKCSSSADSKFDS
ncbi:unnamed protein product [Urochloa humidicola]